MTPIIRKAIPEDLPRICEIEETCFPKAEAASEESLRDRLRYFSDSFFVAEEQGVIIGFINGSLTDSQAIADEMFTDCLLHNPAGSYQSIFGLDVMPEYRCHGVAAQLMKHLIEHTRNQGRKGLILTCKEHLIAYYETLGYECLGVSGSQHGGAVWYDMILEF